MAAGEQGADRSSGRRIAAWATTLASPLIAWLIVKSAAAGFSVATAVALAPLPPENPAPTLKVLASSAQQPTLRVTPEMQQASRDGLAELPLAFEPFFVAARAAEQKGDLRRAIALMEEVRHRRPSHPPARMQLMIYYIKAERYPEALSEIDVVLRRNEELRPALLPELTKLVSDPRGRAALATILARGPTWREEFFAAAGARKLATSDARDLYERIRALKPRHDLMLERQLILQTQASSGDYVGARQTWLMALPQQERASNRYMFDGAFRGVRAPGPFGWTFKDVEAGRAEPAKDGQRTYLDVAYFGGQNVTLAEQVLALPPGRHTLRVVARSPNGISSGKIFWRLTCLPGGNAIGALDLAQAGADNRRFSADFTVPSGCPGQSLTLVAEPGDVATPINVEIARMEIAQ
ncbi:MAG TPA: tetratricopeptide repeat protein [Allosphingosinicella sp.]